RLSRIGMWAHQHRNLLTALPHALLEGLKLWVVDRAIAETIGKRRPLDQLRIQFDDLLSGSERFAQPPRLLCFLRRGAEGEPHGANGSRGRALDAGITNRCWNGVRRLFRCLTGEERFQPVLPSVHHNDPPSRPLGSIWRRGG